MTLPRFVRFNIVGAGGIVVQLTTMWLLVTVGHVGYLIATPLSVGAAVLHNFVGHWRWTWRDRMHSAADVMRRFAGFVLANGLLSIAGNLAVTGALVRGTALSPVAANAVAIASCGLVNFLLSDHLVFRGPHRPRARRT